MEIKYHTNNHSKYLIKLHFVIAVKYRKRLLVAAYQMLKTGLIIFFHKY